MTSPDLDRARAAFLAADPGPPVSGPGHLVRVAGDLAAGGPVVVQTPAGFTVELLPARGLDVGHVAVAGLPVSWTSGRDACLDADRTPDPDWLRAWPGGLVTTCGLRNVGLPSGPAHEGLGQHGDYSLRRATGVRAVLTGDGDTERVEVSGVVRDVVPMRHHLVNRRTVTVFTRRPVLRIDDHTENRSTRPEQAPLLYHANLGWPFLDADCVVHGVSAPRGRRGEPVDLPDDWRRMGGPVADEPERVVECDADDGSLPVRVVNPTWRAALRVDWSRETLPRLHLWRIRQPDCYALGIEPANCALEGRAFDQEAGRAPMLAAGQTRHTWIELALTTT